MTAASETLPAYPHREQFWLLFSFSVWCLWNPIDGWRLTPDSGVYIGTAQSMVESGTYWFSGYPNLQYYPGLPILLSLPIRLFGVDFEVLHILCALVGIGAFWLARAYFTPDRYGWTGVAIPFLLGANESLEFQVFYILSDGLFVTTTLAALLLWRIAEERHSRNILIACGIVCAYASLVRFQGLFLCGAFVVALSLRVFHERPRHWQQLTRIAFAGLVFLPFAGWTLRNYIQYTPDTHNLLNHHFFGLHGIKLYAPGFMRTEAIESEWLYGVTNLARMLTALTKTIFGSGIDTWLPYSILSICALLLILVGCRAWFRIATKLERVYVLTSLAYIFWSSLSAKNLYIVPRYWMPLMPFVLVSGGLGLDALQRWARTTPAKPLVNAMILVVLLTATTRVTREWMPRANDVYLQRSTRVLMGLRAFAEASLPPDARLAVSDWGVVPWATQRVSYQLMNDPTHRLSLHRMLHYRTNFLVLFDMGGPIVSATRKMVSDLPSFFTEIYHLQPRKSAWAAVYEVDLDAVSAYLKMMGVDSLEPDGIAVPRNSEARRES